MVVAASANAEFIVDSFALYFTVDGGGRGGMWSPVSLGVVHDSMLILCFTGALLFVPIVKLQS